VTTSTMLWRRLDTPGHDACRLTGGRDGWHLEGAAAFLHEGAPAQLTYRVTCDAEWRTREGSVLGWIGGRPVSVAVQRSAEGSWTVNGTVVPGLDGCVDLDLGFTPATNALQLRRVALEPGQGTDVPVAWLDVDDWTLALLHQRYERTTGDSYWYESPRFGYAATLEVNELGFPTHYPDLWRAES
jgi:uncharacterized protein